VTSYRPRPFEADSRVGVLYNREVSPLGDGEGRRRITPNPSPGTPRHPSYPSGHSTYAEAANELLAWFFLDYREEPNRLADNAGMARLWAGIHYRSDHYRSDHVHGKRLGRAVACMVIAQLEGSHIPRTPDECDPPCPGAVLPANGTGDPPPADDALARASAAREACCREGPKHGERSAVVEHGARPEAGRIRSANAAPAARSGGPVGRPAPRRRSGPEARRRGYDWARLPTAHPRRRPGGAGCRSGAAARSRRISPSTSPSAPSRPRSPPSRGSPAGAGPSRSASRSPSKQEVGLADHEIRSRHGWHRHIALAMLAFLAGLRVKRNPAPPRQGGKGGLDLRSISARARSAIPSAACSSPPA